MTLPALVLVHGGGLAADCWELTVDEINRVAPELTVLVVDLPGRRRLWGAVAWWQPFLLQTILQKSKHAQTDIFIFQWLERLLQPTRKVF